MVTSLSPRVLALFLLCVPFHSTTADKGSVELQIAAMLGADGSQALVTLVGETLYGTSILRRMYEARGFEQLWSNSSIARLGTALNALEEDGLTPEDYRFAAINAQLNAPDVSALDSEQTAKLDILLTESFLRAIYNLYFGKADPELLDPDINFARIYEEGDPKSFLIKYISESRIDEAFDWARPKNLHYVWLKQGLARYRAFLSAGGWEPIPTGDSLKPETTHPRVAMVRERLLVTGDLSKDSRPPGNPDYFDDELKSAVENFQYRHGIDVDGVVGPGTLAVLNVSVQDRINQIRVNLERGRWILHEVYDEFLLVDIAGFEIYWIENNEEIWREKIQVGSEFTRTPIFKGEVQYLDFNPTWTIPPGILRRSVIPALKKDAAYLDKKGYQLLTMDGKPVDSKSVDWAQLKGFPYIVRQPADPNNALGQVKFLFPNSHFVFLHDTNHRELFNRSKRTFSSGCIRVQNPLDLAERLLSGQENWDRAQIDEVIASGETTRVNLKHPMRILIAYNTARVPSVGSQVHFRPDIYKRDSSVLAMLDGPFRLRKRDENGVANTAAK